MKEIAEKINKIRNSVKESKAYELSSILKELTEIKELLFRLTLSGELENIQKMVEKMSGIPMKPEAPKTEQKPDLSRKEAIDELAKMAANKTENNERFFLLHRATENFEYEKSADNNTYETQKETIWVPEYMSGQNSQKDQNPVISAYIPESAISSFPNAHGNSSTWGELGDNPFKHKYAVAVKPGKYQIYQELKN